MTLISRLSKNPIEAAAWGAAAVGTAATVGIGIPALESAETVQHFGAFLDSDTLAAMATDLKVGTQAAFLTFSGTVLALVTAARAGVQAGRLERQGAPLGL